mmetsp:Transcript_1784/g.2421  ORF Transcript_1784/g.2421 Transcript_1784/m.2421 type:complete len:104 (+) Transcript_1784:60-371(+)
MFLSSSFISRMKISHNIFNKGFHLSFAYPLTRGLQTAQKVFQPQQPQLEAESLCYLAAKLKGEHIITEISALGRNSRAPKKANKGKRPCSHVRRKQRRKQRGW